MKPITYTAVLEELGGEYLDLRRHYLRSRDQALPSDERASHAAACLHGQMGLEAVCEWVAHMFDTTSDVVEDLAKDEAYRKAVREAALLEGEALEDAVFDIADMFFAETDLPTVNRIYRDARKEPAA